MSLRSRCGAPLTASFESSAGELYSHVTPVQWWSEASFQSLTTVLLRVAATTPHRRHAGTMYGLWCCSSVEGDKDGHARCEAGSAERLLGRGVRGDHYRAGARPQAARVAEPGRAGFPV